MSAIEWRDGVLTDRVEVECDGGDVLIHHATEDETQGCRVALRAPRAQALRIAQAILREAAP